VLVYINTMTLEHFILRNIKFNTSLSYTIDWPMFYKLAIFFRKYSEVIWNY